jgi:hypothetical protein
MKSLKQKEAANITGKLGCFLQKWVKCIEIGYAM